MSVMRSKQVYHLMIGVLFITYFLLIVPPLAYNGFVCSCRRTCNVPLYVPVSNSLKHWGHFMWGYCGVLMLFIVSNRMPYLWSQIISTMTALCCIVCYPFYNLIKRLISSNDALHRSSYIDNLIDHMLGVVFGFLIVGIDVFLKVLWRKPRDYLPTQNKIVMGGALLSIVVLVCMLATSMRNSSEPVDCPPCDLQKCESYRSDLPIREIGWFICVALAVLAFGVSNGIKPQIANNNVQRFEITPVTSAFPTR